MRTIIRFCNSYALEEFVYTGLQTEGQEEFRDIRLRRERFSLTSDQVISMFISLHSVIINEDLSNACFIKLGRSDTGENVITEDTELRLITMDKEEIRMFVFFETGSEMSFYRMERGRAVSLGRSINQTISCIEDAFLADIHLMLSAVNDGGRLNVKGREGCYLNTRFVGHMESAAVGYGDVITAGDIRILWLDDCIGIEKLTGPGTKTGGNRLCIVRLEKLKKYNDMLLKPGRDRVEEFVPAPRSMGVTDNSEIELDPPPPRKEMRKQPAVLSIGPAFTMAVPMSIGCGLYIYSASGSGFAGSAAYMYTGLVTAITSALLGVMWAVINIRSQKKILCEEEELRNRAYAEYIRKSNRKILEKYRYNSNILLRNYPSVSELAGSNYMSFLWSREISDGDFLKYRLGTGSMAFEAQIKVPKERFQMVPDELSELPSMLRNKYAYMHDVPVCIDLGTDPLIGFVSSAPGELMQMFLNISLQIAALSDPYLVKMIFLFSGNLIKDEAVEIMHWLPHVQDADEHFVCLDKDRCSDAVCLIEQKIRGINCEDVKYIILTDDYRHVTPALRREAAVSICLFAGEYHSLPASCGKVVRNDISFRGMVGTGEGNIRKEIRFDNVPLKDAMGFVRRLAGVRYIKEGGHREIPSKVTLLQLFGVKLITDEFIIENWKKNNTGYSIRAPIGMAEDCRVIYLDLHEKTHGPHGLIAGMTGSGKSEMLQTLILSLAVRYPPSEIGFFLIDYKGGGMANLFEKLPHMVGSISNLSGNMIHRAMVSIRSENERRQRLFLKAGVNSIKDYGRLFGLGRVDEPLPHILIIIDEFAELKREEPEFMKELISVAQVGRSLGVHLILATQKPSGTVDDNIFCNSRFRICLRVQDKQDSNDMLLRPDAAYISNPGRAFLQVGNDEMFEAFQAAYTMEPYVEEGNLTKASLVDRYGRRHEIELPEKEEKKYGNDNWEDESYPTHFSMILDTLIRCYGTEEYPVISKLWLPLLPEKIEIEYDNCSPTLPDMKRSGCEGQEIYEVTIGMYDSPGEQIQGDYRLNLVKDGNLIICGSSGSGKSTFLQTWIYSQMVNRTPAEISFYIVDYSNGILSCFSDSMLVGCYITEDTQDRLKNLFHMLMELMNERRTAWSGIGFAQRLSLNAPTEPAVVLVIDNYGNFREKTDQKFDREMLELIKFGETYGIFIVLSGTAIGNSDIPSRLFENCRTGICLRLNDKYQYSDCLREIRIPIFPADGIKGRGLARINGEILEFQAGLCHMGSDHERSGWIQAQIEKLNVRYSGMCAVRVPYIPEDPGIADLGICTVDRADWKDGIPLGYETESGKPWVLPLEEVCIIAVAGRKGSGMTNACLTVRYFAERTGRIVREIASVEELLSEIRELSLCVNEDHGSESGNDRRFLICDDLSGKLAVFYESDYDRDVEEEILHFLRTNKGYSLFAALGSEDHTRLVGRRLYEMIRENCAAVYLGGGLDRQNIFDCAYLSYTEQCASKPVGTGTVIKRRGIRYSSDIIIPRFDR